MLLIRFESACSTRKQARRDASGHRDAEPLFSRPLARTRMHMLGIEPVIVGLFGWTLSRHGLRFAVGGLTGIGRIAQHPPHHRALPLRRPPTGGDLVRRQVSGHGADTEPVLDIAPEDPPHDLRFLGVHLIARLAGCTRGNIAIAIRVRPRARSRDLAWLCGASLGGCVRASSHVHIPPSRLASGAAVDPLGSARWAD